MNVAVVLGPDLSVLEGAPAVASAARVRSRAAEASAADRARALRADLPDVDAVLLVDHAYPVRADWAAGGAPVALLADHLNLTGDNPLVGPNADEWGPRFPDMTDAYAPDLRSALRDAAIATGLDLREGVLAGVAPTTRTHAEVAMLRTLGADMASPGFVHEAITARHAGRSVVALALLTTGTSRQTDAGMFSAAVELAVRVVASHPTGVAG